MTKSDSDYVTDCSLYLRSVTVEDAGKYKVTARNDLGESNATISLNFDSKYIPDCNATISLNFDSKFTKYNATVSLNFDSKYTKYKATISLNFDSMYPLNPLLPSA